MTSGDDSVCNSESCHVDKIVTNFCAILRQTAHIITKDIYNLNIFFISEVLKTPENQENRRMNCV